MEDIFEKYRTKKGEILLGDQYLILKKIGNGAFGDVYMVRCSKTGHTLAVKVERKTSDTRQIWSLGHEFSIYKKLGDDNGFPKVYGVYEEENFHWLAMQLLGPSLNDLLPRCNQKFSIKTTLMLADQLLQRIEYVHRQGFLHRDIKPANLLMGPIGSELQERLYMVDFGLAKRYRNPKTGDHIEFARKKGLVGTIGFNSINAMKHYEQSRRDDIEGIGYVLIHLAKGRLPWHRVMAKTNTELQRKVLEAKEKTTLEDLCSGLPDVFIDYMKYARMLQFEEKPHYDKLRELFRIELREAGYVNDRNFDWIQIREIRRKRFRSNNRRATKSEKYQRGTSKHRANERKTER